MVKQWVQPPINKRFLLEYGGESFEIQFLAIFYTDFNKGFNQIWNRVFFTIRVFHWTIRCTLKTRDVAIFFPTCSHHLPIFLHHFPIFCPCELGICECSMPHRGPKRQPWPRAGPDGRGDGPLNFKWDDGIIQMMKWIIQYSYIYIVVGGFNPLWKIWKSVGMIIPIYYMKK